MRSIPAVLFLLAIVLTGCSITTQRQGGVRVVSNVPDAILYVDEEARGPVRAFGHRYIYLDSGRHRLMLERSGFFPEFAEVEIHSNMGTLVRFEMRRQPE